MFQDLKNLYHLLVVFLACLFYRYPAKNLKVIGVTGTDGKTTTVHLIYHILKSAGKKVSLISTIKAVIDDKEYNLGFHVTTPDPWQVQKHLFEAKNMGSEYMVLEVTSHALDQNRVAFCNFLVGVLTNISSEHLDYHRTYERYVQAKAHLFKTTKIAVVNRDDKSYSIIKSKLGQNLRLITFGMGKDADINPYEFPFKKTLIGRFNNYNILAAVGACRALGLDDNQIKKGIESFKLPTGRGEIVYQNDFAVMIDFAHTPNAFENVLSCLRPKIRGRLIHVFGSAGERDSQKRPEMGRISAKYADIIVLTAEDPRSESVEKIMDAINKGIFNFQFSIFNQAQNFQFQKNKKYIFRIPNRQEAITFAIKMAKKGDLVLITGKAHEKSINLGKGEEPWDEYVAVENALHLRSG